MRLMKMFGLAAVAAVAAMAFVGVTSASALKPTQLCNIHSVDSGLKCADGWAASSVHATLQEGTVGKLLSPITVLCLLVLVRATPLLLANPQEVHVLELNFSGCGTGAAHDNCTVTTEVLPLNKLLKTGLDAGSLEAASGLTRLQCVNIGIDCKYDLAGSLFSAGAQHLTANETPTTELGGKFVCPNEGFLDGLLEVLKTEKRYILE